MAPSRRATEILADPRLGFESAVRRWNEVRATPVDLAWRTHLRPIARHLGAHPHVLGELTPARLVGSAVVHLRHRPPRPMVFVCGGPPGEACVLVARLRGRRAPEVARLRFRAAATCTDDDPSDQSILGRRLIVGSRSLVVLDADGPAAAFSWPLSSGAELARALGDAIRT